MNIEFKEMLYLLSCGITDTVPKKSLHADLNKVLELAAEQEVWDFVALSLLKCFGQGESVSEITKSLRMRLQMNMTAAFVRTDVLYQKVHLLEENGIKCCTLKGLSLAALYPKPDCRRSGDIDILVDPKDEDRALEILKNNGFSIKPRHETYNQTTCIYEDGGIIEIHISLHDSIREKMMFSGKNSLTEPFRKMNIPEYFEITTLGYNDGMMFNFLHCIKHFLGSGVGIRQITDVLLYLTKYKEYINYEIFEKSLEEMNYKRFFDACICIGVKYLGFEADALPAVCVDEELEKTVEALLDDIQEGGVFGRNKEERHTFFYKYIKQVAQVQEQEETINKSYMHAGFWKVVFPSADVLYMKYPYCKKHKILLPLAWLERTINFLRIRRKRKKTNLRRIRLLEALKIKQESEGQ